MIISNLNFSIFLFITVKKKVEKKRGKKNRKIERLNFENLWFVRRKKKELRLHIVVKLGNDFETEFNWSIHQTFFGKQLEMWLQANSCPWPFSRKFLCKLFGINLVRTEVKMVEYGSTGNNLVLFCHQLQLHLNSSLKFFSLFDSSQTLHLHRIFNRFF